MLANASIQKITKRRAPEAQCDLGGLRGRRSNAPRSSRIASDGNALGVHLHRSLGYQFVLCGCQRSPGCFSRRVHRLHRVLNLFEGAGLDLAYALPAHAEFGGEIC